MDTMTLLRERATLKGEVAYLRARVGTSRCGSSVVRRAQADALSMIEARYGGYGTGRVEMGRAGMGKRRWAWAVAYLRHAGVVSVRTGNWRRGLRWQVTEVVAVQRIADAAGVTYTQLCGLRRDV